MGLHWQVARLSGNPELQISEADGKEWLLRCQNVMRHYPLTASQKAVDWAAFTFVTSFMYLPRIVAIQQRRAAAAAAPEAPSATVFQFNAAGAAAGPVGGRGNGKANQSDPFPPPPPIPPTVDGVVDEPELEPA